MNTQLILDYLSDLRDHNQREWYHAHQAENKAASAEFESLVGELIACIGEFDQSIVHNEPKSLTFKLVRDTRFSRDKSPYHPAFRAHIASRGKLPIPVGYYIMIKPDNQSFLGVDCLRTCSRMQQRGYEIILIITERNGRASFMRRSLKNILQYRGQCSRMFRPDTIKRIRRQNI